MPFMVFGGSSVEARRGSKFLRSSVAEVPRGWHPMLGHARRIGVDVDFARRCLDAFDGSSTGTP